jgi:hypothetical protein
MKILCILSIALAAGLSVVTWTSQASAAGRDAAISRCIAQAQKQYPRAGRQGNMSNRTSSYKACMHAAGFRP